MSRRTLVTLQVLVLILLVLPFSGAYAQVKCSYGGVPVSCDDGPGRAGGSARTRVDPAQRQRNEALSKGNKAFNEGLTLRQRKRFVEAEAKFREAINYLEKQLGQRDAASWANLGYALWGQEKWDEALAALNAALERDPDSPATRTNAQYLEAYLLEIENDQVAAESARRTAEGTNAANDRGTQLFAQKDYVGAEAAYREGLRLDPTDSRMQSNLALALEMQGRLAEAEASYRKAVELDPKYSAAHRGLGHFLYDLKRYDDAERSLRTAIQLNPDDSNSRLVLGDVLNNQGRLGEAEIQYREAARLSPADFLGQTRLGYVLFENGKYAESESVYREATRLDPASLSARFGMADAMAYQGKHAQAEAIYLDLLQKVPQSQDVHLSLAQVLEKQERYAEAEAAYRKVLEFNPGREEAARGLRGIQERNAAPSSDTDARRQLYAIEKNSTELKRLSDKNSSDNQAMTAAGLAKEGFDTPAKRGADSPRVENALQDLTARDRTAAAQIANHPTFQSLTSDRQAAVNKLEELDAQLASIREKKSKREGNQGELDVQESKIRIEMAPIESKIQTIDVQRESFIVNFKRSNQPAASRPTTVPPSPR